MSVSKAENRDCMEALKEFPDGFFECCVADPPYGINITGRHRSQTVNVERERERERAGHRLSVEEPDRLEVRAKPYGAAKSNLANQRFILCSMIAPRRTQKYLGSYRG